MVFYHYTTRAALESIAREGLTRGEAPISLERFAHAINLTTDPDPSGHGLDCGGRVVSEADSAVFSANGFKIPAGTVYANKRETRITLKLPLSDPKLKQWRTWSRKNCNPDFLAKLEQTAGATPRKAKTWWLYFGVVPSSLFTSIDILLPADTV